MIYIPETSCIQLPNALTAQGMRASRDAKTQGVKSACRRTHPKQRPRTEGAMQPDLREKIERALADVGEVAYQRRSHHRGNPKLTTGRLKTNNGEHPNRQRDKAQRIAYDHTRTTGHSKQTAGNHKTYSVDTDTLATSHSASEI